jgi:hypothetical protein
MADCVVTGTLLQTNNQPFGVNRRALTVVQVVKSGALYMVIPISRPTNASGVVTFTVPQSSTAYVYADANGLNANGTAGVALTIPASATANLEDLVSVTSIPAEGVTVKDEGTALTTLVGTFDFVGSGVAVTQPTAGTATVTITAGSGVTLREVDGAPSIAASTLEFAQASGFVVTDQTGGVGRVDVLAIPVNKLAALTASRVPVIDGDGFLSVSSVTTTTLGFLDATSSIQTQMDGKQPLDADLTAIAALTPTNDDVMQRKAGAWVNRSIAQLMTDLSLSGTNTGDQTSVSGNAGTATALQTARNINGVAFDGTANITVTAAAGTLSGATLASGVTASSLTSFGASIALGTPGSGVLTSCTGLPPATGIVGWPANASGVLTNDGAGALSWAAGGGGSPGGSDTQVQFNDGGAFGGDAGLTYNKTSNLLTITSGNITVPGAGAGSERFGAAAVASGAGSTAIGSAATTSTFTNSVAVGDTATVTANSGTTVGHGATSASGSVAVGSGALAAGNGAISIGNAATTGSATQAIAIGNSSVSGGGITIGRGSSGNTGLQVIVGDSSIATGTQSILIGNSLADSGVPMTCQIGGFFKNVGGVAQIGNGTSISQWGSLQCGKYDAGLNTAPVGLTLGHQTSGTKASIVNPFGISLLFNADSTTTADQNCAQITALWTTPTHASVVSDLVFYTRTGGAALAEAGRFTGAKDLNLVGNLLVSSTKVVGAQGAAVADASGGGVIDAEARTALNTLLARLRTHGLIAT